MSMNALLVGEDDKYSQINQIVVGRDVLFEAIAFYLLTALVDSWSLWIAVAGDEDLGRRWRAISLRMVTSTGDYQPYEFIVGRATAEVGLPPDRAAALLARRSELRPWPEGPNILRRLQRRRLLCCHAESARSRTPLSK